MARGPTAKPPPSSEDLAFPQAPKWLGKDERRVWKALESALKGRKNVGEIDSNLLCQYAETFTLWRKATDAIREKGLTFDYRGAIKCNPAVRVADGAAKLLVVIGRELGLSPLAREKMRAPQANSNSNPLMAFLNKPESAPPPLRRAASRATSPQKPST